MKIKIPVSLSYFVSRTVFPLQSRYQISVHSPTIHHFSQSIPKTRNCNTELKAHNHGFCLQ